MTYEPGSIFDEYADNYNEVVNGTIESSGETVDFFIDLRVKLMWRKLNPIANIDILRIDNILDFGCGIGNTVLYLQKFFPLSCIKGFDTSRMSIISARSSHSSLDAEFASGDGNSLPYPDSYFDLIYTNGTMHHIHKDQRSAQISELKRILKPGGFLFIFENNPYNFLTRRAMQLNPFDRGASMLTLSNLEDLGNSHGLRIIEAWYYFFFPRVFKFLRPLERIMGWIPLGGQYCIWLTARRT